MRAKIRNVPEVSATGLESKKALKADFADLRSTYDLMTEGRDIPLAVKAAELLA